ncbi:hypothetical protein [Acetobacter fallax]|uniref:Secreted protein n=1 Tax=Acetobacter fallax TaxID=1737473 RepID=A0ABX0KAQ4_9PROT|nr:hypothetical protein [Acetobacter fallax]NHO32286.1 hypothetical protein [Acetobacter fallax]NHO35846.1 hypothetical protein [Acetobacter fallax]
MKRVILLVVMPALALELCGATAEQEVTGSSPALFTANQLPSYLNADKARSEQENQDRKEAENDSGIEVTSDSRDFCSRLLHVIDARSNDAVSSIRTLRHEGERLCDEGHVRLGLARLREALIMLKGKDHQ